MNGWIATAFVLGMFAGSLLTVFFLSIMKSGANADRDMEIAAALKELDDKKAANE